MAFTRSGGWRCLIAVVVAVGGGDGVCCVGWKSAEELEPQVRAPRSNESGWASETTHDCANRFVRTFAVDLIVFSHQLHSSLRA